MKYIPQLDALRCIAVFIVIFHHLPLVTGDNYIFYFFRNITGVDVFFVLSGFLITSILLKISTNKNGIRTNLLNFYGRRFLRIFPIYYLSILFLIIVNPSNYIDYAINDALYISNFKMGLDNSFSSITPHFWSLSVEEQFYLFWPIVILLLKDKSSRVWLLLNSLFLFFLGAWIVMYQGEYAFLGRLTVGAYSYLMLGGIIAYLRTYRSQAFNSISKLWWLGLIAALIMPFQYILDIQIEPIINQLIYLFIGGFFVIKFSNGFTSALGVAIFESKPIIFLGKISYGLYLYHFIALHGVVILNKLLGINLPVAGPEGSAVKIIATIIIASVSWYIIEKPLLKLKSKFQYS